MADAVEGARQGAGIQASKVADMAADMAAELGEKNINGGLPFATLVSKAGSAGAVATLAGLANYYGWRFILSMLFLPSQIVYVMRQKDIEANREQFLKEVKNASRISVPTGQNGSEKLDGILLRHPNASCRKFYVQLNANGVCYEEKLGIACDVQQIIRHPCHMVFVNYKGVGASTGRTSCGNDLVEDGIAVVEWLCKEHGATYDNIILHGHSIGGAAAVLAAAALARKRNINGNVGLLPRSNEPRSNSLDPTQATSQSSAQESLPFVLADRTFYSLADVVKDKLGEDFDMTPIGGFLFLDGAIVTFSIIRLGLGVDLPVIPGLSALTALGIAALVVTSLNRSVSPTWPLDEKARKSSPNMKKVITYGILGLRTFACTTLLLMISSIVGPAWEYTVFIAALGAFLGKQNRLNSFALRLVRFLGWDMDVGPAWKTLPHNRKLILGHPQDGMIPSHVSLVQDHDTSNRIMLSSTSADPHMYEFYAVISERSQVLDALRDFFTTY